MAPGVSTVLQAASLFLGIFSIVGLFVRQYLTHPGDSYETKVRELQQEQWRSVSPELGEVFVDVERDFTPTDVEEEDAPLSAKYGLFIKSQYNRGLFDDLQSELDEMEDIREVFERCRECYHDALPMFVISLMLLIPGAGILLWSVGPSIIATSGVIFGIGGILFGRGMIKSWRYWRARQELDDMWEDHYLF